MRNDNCPNVKRDVSQATMTKRNRDGLKAAPEFRADLRAGYLDALASRPWPRERTLGDDRSQNFYATGRHMGAVARRLPKPPAWPESAIFPPAMQSLLNETWE